MTDDELNSITSYNFGFGNGYNHGVEEARRAAEGTRLRADAAEAKLATLGANLAEAREELEIARLPHEAPYVDPEHQGGNCIDVIMQKIGETLTAERERDEARGKLAELDKGIRDALHGLESDLGDDATLPARVDELHESYLDATRAGGVYLAEREKAVGKLNQVRAAVEEWGPGLYDRLVALIEPVTDREEPAQADEPFKLDCPDYHCARSYQQPIGEEVSAVYHALWTHLETVHGAKAIPDLPVAASEEPASAWDVVAGTHRISEAREEPAQHIGRSWGDHPLEDGCPCPQAPCGLVSTDEVSADCPEHPMQRGKTIRQSHSATECPALKTDEENR